MKAFFADDLLPANTELEKHSHIWKERSWMGQPVVFETPGLCSGFDKRSWFFFSGSQHSAQQPWNWWITKGCSSRVWHETSGVPDEGCAVSRGLSLLVLPGEQRVSETEGSIRTRNTETGLFSASSLSLPPPSSSFFSEFLHYDLYSANNGNSGTAFKTFLPNSWDVL